MLLLFFGNIGNSMALNLKSSDDAEPVAQIGETKYVSLQAALDAAHEMTGDVTIELIDDMEGYFTIGDPHYVAECGGTYYKTFAEAAAVANGNVITLLENISDTYLMSTGETLMVAKEGHTFNTPSAPESYSVKSTYEGAITIYTLTASENFVSIPNGYYRIKNNGNDRYVNVIGRRTATVNTTESEAESLAGTVIKVESNELGQVEVLRSQAPASRNRGHRFLLYLHCPH